MSWSELVHVAGFALYLGSLGMALRLSRPTTDPDSSQSRFYRAGHLPLCAIVTSVLLLGYSATSGQLVGVAMWVIDLAAAVLFLRAIRRVRNLEQNRLVVQRQTQELWDQVLDRQQSRLSSLGDTQRVIGEGAQRLRRLQQDNI